MHACTRPGTILGQQVAVYGPESDTSTKSTYTIDGQLMSSRTSQGSNQGVLLFHSGVLSYASHTLVINVTQASSSSMFSLDWIAYNTSAHGLSQSVTLPETATSSSASAASSSTSSSSPVGQAHITKPPIPPAAVAGITAGGLVGIISILLVCLALGRRRRRRMNRTPKYSYGEVAQYGTSRQYRHQHNGRTHIFPPL